METGVRRFTDGHGNEIRHAETIASPDAVIPSRSSRTVQFYYRL